MTVGSLLDTSVWSRLRQPAVSQVVVPLLRDGTSWTCALVELELGVAARTASDHEQLVRRMSLLPRAGVDHRVLDRAREVQGLLVRTGQHREVGLPDLLIAACAEVAGLEILHYDHDYELIATVTGQPHRWALPRGTLDQPA